MKKFLEWLGFHFHDWSKWETTEGTANGILYKKPVSVVVQYRVCKTCGFRQVERVR